MIGRGLALCLGLVALAACGANTPRLRLVSSEPTLATWSFVVEDRGGGAELLVDGRPRVTGCYRAGVTIRCELRGMFPGGHTVDLHLAGARLRRSVVLGSPWPDRPVFVRALDVATVVGAGHAGADGVLVPAAIEPASLEELVEAGHKAGLRVLVEGVDPAVTSALIERYALDGVLGTAIEPGVARRFPSARAFSIDSERSRALKDNLAGTPTPLAKLTEGAGLLESRGALGLSLALLAGRGTITDGAGFTLLGVRKRHKALREGTLEILADDGLRRAIRMRAGGDAVTIVANAGPTPYTPQIQMPPVPIDLLGGPMQPTGPTVPPGEVAAILASPDPDRTRY